MVNPLMSITSDLHLEPCAWKDHPSLAGDAYYGLEQIVEAALSYKVKAVALLGDVYNVRTPDPHTVAVCCSAIERLWRNDIQVLYIQGQHELSRDTPWLNVHLWPKHIHKLCIELVDGVVAYGLDWTPASRVVKELEAIPAETSILLSHQVWHEFHGSKIDTECSFADVPEHVTMVFTGDYHKHFVTEHRNRGGKVMKVCSPGSICMQSRSEPPHKAFFMLMDDGVAHSVALKSRKCLEFDIEDADSLESFLHPKNIEWLVEPQSGVPENIAKPMLVVHYPHDLSDAYQRLTKSLGSKVHLFPVAKRTQTAPKPKRLSVKSGLESALSHVMTPNSAEHKDAIRLCRSTDVKSELECMKDDFLREYYKQGHPKQRGAASR